MILSAECFHLCMYYVLIALRSLEKGFNLLGMLLITGLSILFGVFIFWVMMFLLIEKSTKFLLFF